MSVTLILACAGKGERAGFDKNKLLVPIANKTCLERTLEAFVKNGRIDQFIVVASKADFDTVKKLCGQVATVIEGGKTRTQSVMNGLAIATGDVVLIHDGARPFVSQRLINDCIDTAVRYGSALPVIPTRDTMVSGITSSKDEDKQVVRDYLGKGGLYQVQTPQGFNTAKLKAAYARAGEIIYNDDGEVFKANGNEVVFVEGDINNLKLTYPEDFNNLYPSKSCRVGTGFDCHRLVEGRKLILGGVEIAHVKGLLGHSDADVLTHAVMDAILSAVCERDIGYHFPDTDQRFKGADSLVLLKEVLAIAKRKGYEVSNVSACIMAQKPKLLPHIPAITEKLANALGISKDALGIGATTLEGLGFVGREEGICVQATATLTSVEKQA